MQGGVGALTRRRRLVELGAALRQLRLALREVGCGGIAPGLDLVGEEPRQHLAFLHGRVVVDENLDDLT
jgi:hypothetical protein